MTRAALLLVALGALAGCIVEQPPSGYPPGSYPPPSGSPPPTTGPPVPPGGGATWTFVVDSVSVSDLGSGVAPLVYVSGLLDGYSATTPSDYGFDVAFDAALFDADEATFETDGVDLQVWADYGGGATLVGEITYAPTPDELGVGPIDLGAFGDVLDLRVELQPG